MAGSWLEGGGNGGAVDVVELLTPDAAKGLGSIVQMGALVSLGTTSDGGALGITVTIDGEYRREYVRNEAELGVWLAEAIPGIEDILAGPRPSAASRGRTRRRKAS